MSIVRGITSNRLCAITLNCENGGLLIINGYFPVDTQSKTQVSDTMMDTMDAIDQVLQRFPNHEVIIAGDLNADFCRNNAQDNFIKLFTENNIYII